MTRKRKYRQAMKTQLEVTEGERKVESICLPKGTPGGGRGEGVVRAGGLALRDNKNQTKSAVRSLFKKWKNKRWREGQGHRILFFPSLPRCFSYHVSVNSVCAGFLSKTFT